MLELTRKIKFSPLASARVEQAVILAAGLGSRLARGDGDIKPLKNVGGVSLIGRNIALLAECGLKEVIVVTGYHAQELQEALQEQCAHLPITVRFAFNAQYRLSNGLSVLAAQHEIRGNFLLMMADHIFEPKMMREASLLVPPKNGALLLVDYKLSQIFDMDDATKVWVQKGRVCAISKSLSQYNAVDTGLFVCSRALLDALRTAQGRSPISDCSLSEGVATLVESGRMFTHDIKNAIWQDVDDEYMLEQAEILVQKQFSPSLGMPIAHSAAILNAAVAVSA